jgi:hypothetical protein
MKNYKIYYEEGDASSPTLGCYDSFEVRMSLPFVCLWGTYPKYILLLLLLFETKND